MGVAAYVSTAASPVAVQLPWHPIKFLLPLKACACNFPGLGGDSGLLNAQYCVWFSVGMPAGWQAFKHGNVDLPAEGAQAPYAAITLPENYDSADLLGGFSIECAT